jgi:hypothetical protein
VAQEAHHAGSLQRAPRLRLFPRAPFLFQFLQIQIIQFGSSLIIFMGTLFVEARAA